MVASRQRAKAGMGRLFYPSLSIYTYILYFIHIEIWLNILTEASKGKSAFKVESMPSRTRRFQLPFSLRFARWGRERPATGARQKCFSHRTKELRELPLLLGAPGCRSGLIRAQQSHSKIQEPRHGGKLSQAIISGEAKRQMSMPANICSLKSDAQNLPKLI